MTFILLAWSCGWAVAAVKCPVLGGGALLIPSLGEAPEAGRSHQRSHQQDSQASGIAGSRHVHRPALHSQRYSILHGKLRPAHSPAAAGTWSHAGCMAQMAGHPKQRNHAGHLSAGTPPSGDQGPGGTAWSASQHTRTHVYLYMVTVGGSQICCMHGLGQEIERATAGGDAVQTPNASHRQRPCV